MHIGRTVYADIVWEDPVGEVVSRHKQKLEPSWTITNHKPKLEKPLRAGVWKVMLLHPGGSAFMQVQFLVTPVKFDKKTPLANPSSANGKLAQVQPANGVDLQRFELWKEKVLSNGEKLDNWVDRLVSEFWRVEGMCGVAAAVRQCRSLINCENTHWSTLSPDPKSELGPVQASGRLR